MTTASGSRLPAAIEGHQTLAFVALTLALSWGWWTLAAVVLGDGGLSTGLIIPGGFGPLVAAAVVTRASGGSVRAWAAQALRWRVAPRWYALAVAVPVAITLGGVGVGLLLAGGPLDLSVLPARLPAFAVNLVVVALVGGGQEEFGWRGFALPRLQRTHGALAASLLVGAAWAVWHLPLFLFGAPRNQTGNFLLYGALVLAFSVLLTWCYNSTKGSVLLALLFHAAVNASGTLVPAPVSALDSWALAVDVGWVAGAWLAAAAVIAWGSPETLSRRGVVTPGRVGAAPADGSTTGDPDRRTGETT